jgi:hypothetical protein
VAGRPAVERPDLAWPEFSWPEAAADPRGPFEPKLSGPKASRLRFEPGQDSFADPFADPSAEPQQVPLPESLADAGWLDTVHWQDHSESDEDPDESQPARRPGSPFRRRKGGSS